MFYTYALWYGEYVDILLMKQEKKRKNTSHIIQQQNIKQEIDNNRRQNNQLVLKQLIEFGPWVIFVFRSWGRL